MAKKKAGGASKSDLIRTTSAANPTVGPTEIAKMIQTAHNVKVSPAMVSTVLSQDRSRGNSPAKRGRPPAAKRAGRPAGGGNFSWDALVRIKKLADELGGVAEARRALDALSQIIS
jgi:hypothetical protein